MSETLYMRISTQNIACSQRQMHTCTCRETDRHTHTEGRERGEGRGERERERGGSMWTLVPDS